MAMEFELTVDETAPVFVISVAAELAGMHPQTLRQYDRLGLVRPDRAAGRGRRYSPRDVATLREVQRLSQDEGVNLAGIKRILELENVAGQLRSRLAQALAEITELHEQLRHHEARRGRVFAAGPAGDIVAMPPGRRPGPWSSTSTSLVVWRPQRPGRRHE
jgi:MerR family transcriptional regulator/heat shock protein HspR